MIRAANPDYFIPTGENNQITKAFQIIAEKGKSAEREIAEVKKTVSSTVTADDTTPPNPVTGLKATKFETHIKIEWANPSNADLSSIRVTKTVNGVESPESFIIAAPTNYIDDLDTIATSDYQYSVVTQDKTGNESTPETVSVLAVTLPAPDEILNESWTGDDLELSWDAVDGFGVSGYRVEVYNNLDLKRTENTSETKFSYTYAKNMRR